MIEFTMQQVAELLEMFGGDDESTITVSRETTGHSGAGLYAHVSDYPDEGSLLLGEPVPQEPEVHLQARVTLELLRRLARYPWTCRRQRSVRPGFWQDCGECDDCAMRTTMREI